MVVNPTYISVPDFGASADIVTPPSPSPYVDGYEPNQLFPAQHANYFFNGLTTNDNLGFTALQHVIAELGNVVTKSGASITPGDDTQVYTAIQNMAVKDVSFLLSNVGVKASVAANALTIALSQADGSTNPAANSGKVEIAFRSSTQATGGWVVRTVTAALSTVISSGSTAGFVSGSAGNIFVYALDNAGTVELGWVSGRVLDETLVHTSTAEGGAGAADSRGVFYSTTARSNVAVRLIGVITATEATAGTWATAPSAISTLPLEAINFVNVYTPTAASSVGTITTVGTVSGRFATNGKFCYVNINVTITTNGTGSGYVAILLPFTPANNTAAEIVGKETGVSQKTMSGVIPNNTAEVRCVFYDGTYPGANSAVLNMSGWYEMAAI